jgi:hypothetical protein
MKACAIEQGSRHATASARRAAAVAPLPCWHAVLGCPLLLHINACPSNALETDLDCGQHALAGLAAARWQLSNAGFDRAAAHGVQRAVGWRLRLGMLLRCMIVRQALSAQD